MSCPICNNPELSEGAESCPKCGSDLEVFAHIEGAQKEHAFQKKSVLILAALLGIVVVSWGSVSMFSGDKAKTTSETASADSTKTVAVVPVSAPDSALFAQAAITEYVQKENESLRSEIASLKSDMKSIKSLKATAKAPASKEPAEKETKTKKAKHAKAKEEVQISSAAKTEGDIIIHTVKRGDSPWTISKKYFRNGSHAKQIIADNNLENMKNIPIGTKLKIQK